MAGCVHHGDEEHHGDEDSLGNQKISPDIVPQMVFGWVVRVCLPTHPSHRGQTTHVMSPRLILIHAPRALGLKRFAQLFLYGVLHVQSTWHTSFRPSPSPRLNLISNLLDSFVNISNGVTGQSHQRLPNCLLTETRLQMWLIAFLQALDKPDLGW